MSQKKAREARQQVAVAKATKKSVLQRVIDTCKGAAEEVRR